MKEDDMDCMECGADCAILLSTHKRKDRQGNCYWVCSDCFRELEGVSYEDYRTFQE